jgi:hypothetical protein
MPTAYSGERERRFHAIVNVQQVSAAEAADVGSGVHDNIGEPSIPAVTYSDSQTQTTESLPRFCPRQGVARDRCCGRRRRLAHRVSPGFELDAVTVVNQTVQ